MTNVAEELEFRFNTNEDYFSPTIVPTDKENGEYRPIDLRKDEICSIFLFTLAFKQYQYGPENVQFHDEQGGFLKAPGENGKWQGYAAIYTRGEKQNPIEWSEWRSDIGGVATNFYKQMNYKTG